MRLYGNELRRVCIKPIFLLMTVVLFLANGVFLLGQTTDYEQIYQGTKQEYREAYATFRGKSFEEIEKTISERLEEIEVYQDIERYYMMTAQGVSATLPEEATPQVLKTYETGNYLQYSSTASGEAALLNEILEVSRQCASYPEYIASMEDRAQQMLSVSLFSKNMSAFEGENIKKTPADFQAVADVKPVVDISFGVQKVSDSMMTDLMIFFLVFAVGAMLFLSGETKEMRNLTRPTVNGRVPLSLAKLGAAVTITLILVLLFEAQNFVIFGTGYSFGDLSRPIQSVTGFQNCNLSLSVLEYFCLYIGIKCLMFLFVVSFVAVCSVWVRNAAVLYLITAVVTVLGTLFTLLIPQNSYLNILRFLNPVNAVYAHTMLSVYQNVNIFSKAVGLFSTVLILYSVLTVLFLVGTIVGFCRIGSGIKWGRSFARLWEQVYAKFGGKRGQTHVFLHEAYKLFFSERAWIVLAALALLQISFYQQNDFPALQTSEDIAMESICQELKGKDSPENDAMIDSFVQKNNKVDEAIDVLDEEYQSGKMGEQDYQKAYANLQAQKVPSNLMARLLAMQENVKTNGAEYIYDGSYRVFLTLTNKEEQLNFTAVMALILLLSALFCREHTKGMDTLIAATKNGRGRVFVSKIGLSLLLTVTVWALCYVPQMILYLKAYGSPFSDAPVHSILILSGVRLPLSITGAIWFGYGMKLLSLVVAAVIVLEISERSKSILTVLLTSTALLILPQALSLLGLEWTDYVSLNGGLYVPRIFQGIGESMVSSIQLLYYVLYIGICVSVIIVLLLKLWKHVGKRITHKNT